MFISSATLGSRLAVVVLSGGTSVPKHHLIVSRSYTAGSLSGKWISRAEVFHGATLLHPGRIIIDRPIRPWQNTVHPYSILTQRRTRADVKEESTTRLRCTPGDLVRVIGSTNPELIGTIALIQRLRRDGRWDVLLDRPTLGVTLRSRRAVITREFCFRDQSLEPIGNVGYLIRSRFSHLMADRCCPNLVLQEVEKVAP